MCSPSVWPVCCVLISTSLQIGVTGDSFSILTVFTNGVNMARRRVRATSQWRVVVLLVVTLAAPHDGTGRDLHNDTEILLTLTGPQRYDKDTYG